MHPIYRTDVPLLPTVHFYIFSQQIYFIIFLDFLSPSSSIPPQNVVYFLMLPFLVHKMFTFYINVVLNCKCTAPGPKGRRINHLTPNDSYRGRTAPLTCKRCILYIYSRNIGTEYFKQCIYFPFFLFKMQFVS